MQNHLSSFDQEKSQILLLLAPEKPTEDFNKQVRHDILNFNKTNNKLVNYRCVCFEDIIKVMREVLSEQDFEIQEILEDYVEFCDEEGLLPIGKYTMRVVVCTQSFSTNMKYNMYYAPASRSFRDFKYLGIYADKEVKALGRLHSIVKVYEGGKIEGDGFRYDVLKGTAPTHAIEQIAPMIKDAFELHQHDLRREPHTFFIVDKFLDTRFRKASSGGLFSQRYLDLRDYVEDADILNDSVRLADYLTSKTWV